nr:putative RNA-directed DNA polymerase [Tanacetum cinerariifolium]
MEAASREENNNDDMEEATVILEENEPQMQIMNTWKRPEGRSPGERYLTKYVVSPIIGELIPVNEMTTEEEVSNTVKDEIEKKNDQQPKQSQVRRVLVSIQTLERSKERYTSVYEMTTESSNFQTPCVPKFDEDYDHWRLIMENLLHSKEYRCVIEPGYKEPEDGAQLTTVQQKALDEARLKDLKARNYLFQAIDKSILKTITQKETAKQLWESMKVKYQGNARVKQAQLQRLRREFETLEMKTGESVIYYFGRALVVVNDMRNYGESMDDVKIVEKILRTLTESFNFVVCSIEESKDINTLTEVGKYICCLRSDRGGEYTSNSFNQFGEAHGIKRCLLAEKEMPKHFWPEAAKWACYVLNRCSTNTLNDMVPKECWSGIKPNVDYFRVFGCIAHVHVPKQDWKANEAESSFKNLDWGEESATVQVEQDKEEENEVEQRTTEIMRYQPDPKNLSDKEGSSQVRNRRQPVWMDDYESGEGLSEDEELVVRSEGVKTIGVKWVFKTKLNENGEVEKYKARLVVKGYAQKKGVDYDEVFAPIARWDTIRTLLAVDVQKGWNVYQLDVKSAFLYGELKEVVYVDQPQGFVKKGEETKVYCLKKALYGIKQAPRAWFSRIEGYFIREGFKKSNYDHTMFIKRDGKGLLIVSLYIDDLIYVENDALLCERFKKSMQQEFEMTDLGMMRFFLGIEIQQSSKGIYLCQRKYAKEVLERFGIWNCNSVKNPIVPGTVLTKEGKGKEVDATLYKQLVSSLMYLTVTRPDMMYVVCLISHFIAKPREEHMQAAKRVLRYLKGTLDFGLFYYRNSDSKLKTYTDSDYARDIKDRRCTFGYVFLLSKAAICWSSRKQAIVTLSSTEAEYVAATSCACHCVWLKGVLKDLDFMQGESLEIFCDNSSTIKLSKNPMMHRRTTHIDVRYHYLRDFTNQQVVNLVFCGTQDQIADIMTKPVKLETFVKLRGLFRLQPRED